MAYNVGGGVRLATRTNSPRTPKPARHRLVATSASGATIRITHKASNWIPFARAKGTWQLCQTKIIW